MASLELAIKELHRALDDTGARNWRWVVRQGLSSVKEALDDQRIRSYDGWLAARASVSDRDRAQLMGRVAAMGPRVLERLDPERAHAELDRLLGDLEHFLQRVHDLVYDSVSLELGGSE